MGLEFARRLTARVIYVDKAVWDHLRKAKVLNLPAPLPCYGVPQMNKLSVPLVGAQDDQRFPLLKTYSRSKYSFACCACLQPT